MLDLWIARLCSPSPPVSVFKAFVATGGVFKKGLKLVPLNNGSLGAEKHGPGTNVAIMLMVRITADSHYWPYLKLLCRADDLSAWPRSWKQSILAIRAG